uniref:Bro d n=1 Tax=Spodoptera frugiperda granulovirus TaxID=307454 RepID=A0A346QVY2_9BBAC|nr:bro d [Spodoptera frugiperda granulovirus]
MESTPQSSHTFNVDRLIASNSILCDTIQRLEARLTDAQSRVTTLEKVVIDKDRQLDIMYHRMNELYNVLRQKDTQIQRLSGGNTPVTITEQQLKTLTGKPDNMPVIKLPANKLYPLVKIPIPLYHNIPKIDMVVDQPVQPPPPPPTTSVTSTPGTPVDDSRSMMICVTRVEHLIKAVTAQKLYVDALKKRNEIDLSTIIVETKCKQPQKLWEETMNVCQKKYNSKVKLLRKTLRFVNLRDAEVFANEIEHMYKNFDEWDTNKQYMSD